MTKRMISRLCFPGIVVLISLNILGSLSCTEAENDDDYRYVFKVADYECSHSEDGISQLKLVVESSVGPLSGIIVYYLESDQQLMDYANEGVHNVVYPIPEQSSYTVKWIFFLIIFWLMG